MKKKDIAKKAIQEKINIFRCPLCRQGMYVENRSLVCLDNHCFDLSKNGYVNLLVNSVREKYDKKLFSARNIICQNGLFDEITRTITDKISEHFSADIIILDAGCGEGSHLKAVLNGLKHFVSTGVGIDISKDGIFIASREYPEIIWCVGDLTNTPFNNNQFDIILNIFSPANYDEFKRLLKNHGLLIKVIPQQNH